MRHRVTADIEGHGGHDERALALLRAVIRSEYPCELHPSFHRVRISSAIYRSACACVRPENRSKLMRPEPMSFSSRDVHTAVEERTSAPPRHEAKGGSMAGEVVHVEIRADDIGKGREFWGGLFGWQWEQAPGPFEYHVTRIIEQTGGAITNMEPGKKGPRVYFGVDDINAGAARVKELGGEADAPAPVPGMGLVRDLQGHPGKRVRFVANGPGCPRAN